MDDDEIARQAASYARAQTVIARADAALEASRNREIPDRLWEPPPREPPPAPKPARPAPPRQTAMDAESSRGWNSWLDKEITRRLEKFGKEIVEATLEHLQWRFTRSRELTEERVNGVEDRITKSEEATTELLMELERRVAALEQQQRAAPARPRLVSGGSDVA